MSTEVESETPEIIFADEAKGTRYANSLTNNLSRGDRFPVLAQEIISMLHSRGRNLNQLPRVEQEINKIVAVGILEQPVVDSIKALIAELKGEKEKALSLARAAIAGVKTPSHNDNASFTNSIAVLCSYARYDEAFFEIELSINKWPFNVPVLEYSVISAYVIAQFDRALNYLHKLVAASNADLSPDMIVRLNSLIDLRAAAKSFGFTENDLLKRLMVARVTVEDFGLEVLREKRGQLQDGSSVMYYYLNADRKSCTKCTGKIYQRLADEFEDTGMDLISVICRPVSDYDGPIVRGEKK